MDGSICLRRSAIAGMNIATKNAIDRVENLILLPLNQLENWSIGCTNYIFFADLLPILCSR
jgi:hypothetical protein